MANNTRKPETTATEKQDLQITWRAQGYSAAL